MIKRYFKRLKAEFKGYNAGKFGKDVLAGGHSLTFVGRESQLGRDGILSLQLVGVFPKSR